MTEFLRQGVKVIVMCGKDWWTTHLLIETPDVFPTNIAASPIESAIQRLRERIELIRIATCRKGHDLTTEFVKPARASWQ